MNVFYLDFISLPFLVVSHIIFYSTPSWFPSEVEYLFDECFEILCCWWRVPSSVTEDYILANIWIRYYTSLVIINFECVIPNQHFKISEFLFVKRIVTVGLVMLLDIIHYIFVLLSHYSKPLRYKWWIIISDQVSIIFAVFSQSA